MKKKFMQFMSCTMVAIMIMSMVFGLCGCGKPAEDLVLDVMPIVLPVEATKVEETAAKELRDYVKKMTGFELDIVTEGDGEVPAGIYVGATEYSAAEKVTFPDNELGEGWAIKAVDGNLVLTGGETRGTLYAVYHLLEDVLGVRWWTYWEEYVPTLDEVRVPGDYDDSGVPHFLYRDIHNGRKAQETNVFAVRNRLNGNSSNAPIEYGGEESFGQPSHVHTFSRYFTEADFQAHPEWFALYNGGRISYGQLCMTNDELVEEFTNRVLKSIAESYAAADAQGINRPRYFDISPNDLPEFCTCTNCYASQQEHGRSGDLLIFVNKIAEGVAEWYPEVYIETLAYQEYLDVPLDDTKPADNVVIRLADSEMDILHGVEHYNNENILERIKGWTELCKEGQLYIWDYVVFYGNTGIAPTVYKYPDNFKMMADLGVNGYFGEQEDCISTDLWDMKFWVLAKLCEDPYQDGDALIDEFLNGYYGEAGPYIRQYLDLVSEKAEKSSSYWRFSANTIRPRWMSAEDIIAADGILEQAFAAAEGDDDEMRRVRLVRCALDRVIVTNFEDYVEEAEEEGIAFDLDQKEACQRVVDCLTEQADMRASYDYEISTNLDIYKRKLESLA